MDMSAETGTEARPRGRGWVYVAVAAGVLLLLALTPPYLNVNRLQRRIAASMSASLGRPVHLDHVTLHMLPLPGFTLDNLVVSEDPAFGDEPVIRANTVEITLRLSSLWRRQVELSSIRFVEPSLNLVRNDAGRWNLQSLLTHAAQVNVAPTVQRKAGPEPRFPYIEATDARVNVKLGAEKKPFSLTEADFALWLPDPSGWRVRLSAKPARTDQNITDPGTIKLKGSLRRAETMAAVPVDLTASWEGAPLGQASRIVAGDDANWRGKLTVNATVHGTLGAAKLALSAHVEELRRADFVPVRTLDLLAECSGTADGTTAVVTGPLCKLTSATERAVVVNAVADSVDLSRLTQPETLVGLRVGSAALPESWVFDAARLFSQRIPATVSGTGKLTGSLVWTAYGDGGAPYWLGSFEGDVGQLPGLPAGHGVGSAAEMVLDGTPAGLVLEPLALGSAGGGSAPLLLSGLVDAKGYTLHLTGSATAAELRGLVGALPPVGDGLAEALPELGAGLAKPIRLDLSCVRPWRGTQTCTESAPVVVVKKRRRR
jgi:hypothetical protein